MFNDYNFSFLLAVKFSHHQMLERTVKILVTYLKNAVNEMYCTSFLYISSIIVVQKNRLFM